LPLYQRRRRGKLEKEKEKIEGESGPVKAFRSFYGGEEKGF
jgi:hypothetical protein